MVFENPHSKKYKKGDGFLADLFNTSNKLIKDNKDSLLSVISESSKLKDSISKNIDLNKKITKLDAEKKKQTEKKLSHKTKSASHKTESTPVDTAADAEEEKKKKRNNCLSAKLKNLLTLKKKL